MGRAEEKELAAEAFRLLRKIRRYVQECEDVNGFFEWHLYDDPIGALLKKTRRK